MKQHDAGLNELLRSSASDDTAALDTLCFGVIERLSAARQDSDEQDARRRRFVIVECIRPIDS